MHNSSQIDHVVEKVDSSAAIYGGQLHEMEERIKTMEVLLRELIEVNATAGEGGVCPRSAASTASALARTAVDVCPTRRQTSRTPQCVAGASLMMIAECSACSFCIGV